ncbi:hypothetical protein GQX74_005457 [Glossina fuscipes]|nr:hypothetical protein GQX74_005457 [Glossina fuscipes]
MAENMRIFSVLNAANRKARAPQNEKDVPFQEILPLRLKNRVSGKSDSSSDVACLQEMSILFACLKDNDFVEKFCHKEISQFKKCYKVFMDGKTALKATVNQGIITPGNNLNYRQLNKYMRLFPNPNKHNFKPAQKRSNVNKPLAGVTLRNESKTPCVALVACLTH